MPSDLKLPEGVPPLTTYYMYIAGGCNLACRHCWIAPTFDKDPGNCECLDLDLYKLAIQQGKPLGLTEIKYTGGEPLLHPDFLEMVDYAEKQELRTWMETNGTLITKEIAGHLKTKTNMHHISISIDGADPATHDHFRNVSGSFDAAMAGIASHVLDMAVDHAQSRIQFGRPIGGFQAVRHPCAEMARRTEAARSMVHYAAVRVAAGHDEQYDSVAAARIVSSDAATRNAAETLQILGAMGMTLEHDLNLYLKRAHLLDKALGTSRTDALSLSAR